MQQPALQSIRTRGRSRRDGGGGSVATQQQSFLFRRDISPSKGGQQQPGSAKAEREGSPRAGGPRRVLDEEEREFLEEMAAEQAAQLRMAAWAHLFVYITWVILAWFIFA